MCFDCCCLPLLPKAGGIDDSYAKESRQIVSEVFEIEDDEDHDHSLCARRHGWDYSVVFYGIIPSNPLTSLTIARQTRNHGKFLLAGKVWPFWAK